MSNPLYNQLNSNNSQPMAIISKFNEFARGFTGNPQAEVQRLMNEGKLTQDMYNKMQKPAQLIYNMINR